MSDEITRFEHPGAPDHVAGTIEMHLSTHRRGLAQRGNQRLGLCFLLDAAFNAVLHIAVTFEKQKAAAVEERKKGRLGPVGEREAIAAAARAAELSLTQLEQKGELAQFRTHLQSVRAQLFPPLSPRTGPASIADLEAALTASFIRGAVYEQVAQLTLSERELLARTTQDRDVAAVLESGPPVIRMRHGVAFSEKLIPDVVREAVVMTRARAERPEVAAQYDEIDAETAAVVSLVAIARETIGKAASPIGDHDPRRGTEIMQGPKTTIVQGDTLPLGA
jgi:hypothetical protein